MENESELEFEEERKGKILTLCPTKTGNGYKIVVDGVWYYASKEAVQKVVTKGFSCVFNTIE